MQARTSSGTIALGSFAMSFFWLPSRIFIASESFVAFGKFTESFVCSMKSCTSRMPSLMPRQYWRGDLLLGRFELFHRVRDLPRYASLQEPLGDAHSCLLHLFSAREAWARLCRL